MASYARAYLCRVGMAIAPESRMHLLPNFTDYLTTFSQVGSEVKAGLGPPSLFLSRHLYFPPPPLPPSLPSLSFSVPSLPPSLLLTSLSLQLNSDQVQNTLALQSLDLPAYMHLYVPAIEWILQCVAHKASDVSGSLLSGWCGMPCTPLQSTLDEVLEKLKEGVIRYSVIVLVPRPH